MELRCLGFHEVPSSPPRLTHTLILKIQALTPFECKYQIVSTTPLIFIDVGEDLIMVSDVDTPSNPLIVPIEEEKLEETSFDVNVSQWSNKKKLSRKMVCTQVNCLAWDCRLFLNLHALTIYLKFVHAHGAAPIRFEEC